MSDQDPMSRAERIRVDIAKLEKKLKARYQQEIAKLEKN